MDEKVTGNLSHSEPESNGERRLREERNRTHFYRSLVHHIRDLIDGDVVIDELPSAVRALLRNHDRLQREVDEAMGILISVRKTMVKPIATWEEMLSNNIPERIDRLIGNMPRPVAEEASDEEKPVKHDFAVSPDGKDLSLVEREEASDAEC